VFVERRKIKYEVYSNINRNLLMEEAAYFMSKIKNGLTHLVVYNNYLLK